MPTNHFFQLGRGIGGPNEQDLLQRLITESIQLFGSDFVYLPRDIIKMDSLFKEDYLAEFKRNYTVEMYVENFADFEGNGPLVSKFGFEQNDQMRLICSSERFNAVTGLNFPREGDLIWWPTSMSIFEIKFIDDKHPLFPLGARTYFTITAENWKYSHENMDTGTGADSVTDWYPNDGTAGATELGITQTYPGATGATGVGFAEPFAKNRDISNIADAIKNFDENDPFSERQ